MANGYKTDIGDFQEHINHMAEIKAEEEELLAKQKSIDVHMNQHVALIMEEAKKRISALEREVLPARVELDQHLKVVRKRGQEAAERMDEEMENIKKQLRVDTGNKTDQTDLNGPDSHSTDTPTPKTEDSKVTILKTTAAAGVAEQAPLKGKAGIFLASASSIASINERYPIIVKLPSKRNGIELRCSKCGGNANRNQHLKGSNGFRMHLQMAHPGAIAKSAPMEEVVQMCAYRKLNRSEMKDLKKKGKRGVRVPKIQVMSDAVKAEKDAEANGRSTDNSVAIKDEVNELLADQRGPPSSLVVNLLGSDDEDEDAEPIASRLTKRRPGNINYTIESDDESEN